MPAIAIDRADAMRNLGAVFGVPALCFLWPGQAVPQSTGGRTMIFQGHLELHGVPLTGAFDFKVEIYSSAEQGDCELSPEDGFCLWSTELTDVQVQDGAFELPLGSTDHPLPDEVWLNDAVFLSLRVAGEGEAYTRLAGRQQVLPVPAAAQAATAPDFRVEGQLTVEESSQTGVKNSTVAGDVTVHGGADITGGFEVLAQSPRTFDVTSTGYVWAKEVDAARFYGAMHGQITGGILLRCNDTSAYRRTCGAWGHGNCTGPTINMCGSAVSCSSGVMRRVGGGSCWSSPGGWLTYCHYFICVR